MNFPEPSAKQGRLLWMAATALAVAVLVAAAGVVLLALGWVLNRLSAILLPVAVAGILAYLLQPVVGFFERRGLSRSRSIVWVFALLVAAGLMLLATVVPQLVAETASLIERAPEYTERIRETVSTWLHQSPLGARAQELWESTRGDEFRAWLQDALPQASRWIWEHVGSVLAGLGMLLGFALVPFYLFYFLLHQQGIEKSWTDYLPIQESKLKEEVVFLIRAINDSLIVFFRGQILVALCVGVLATVGYAAVGLNYAFVLGAIAGVLGIVPYLGGFVSVVAALGLAGIQFQDWLHPLLVLGVYAVIQFLEGWFISPRIIGDRVGMHPVTVIIAILIGSSLLGGIVGGVLAIPLAAALRAILRRYVWKE